MKTNPLLTLTLAGALFALTAQAQQAPPPIRILPAPAPPRLHADQPVPPGFQGPGEPGEGWIEPGFPGEMMMPPMPGRYTLLSANLQKDGKLTPIVLRIDTQTGQVWQLKTITQTRRHNGKIVTESHLSFVMVSEPIGGLGHGARPGPDDGPAVIEDVPVEPNRPVRRPIRPTVSPRRDR